jgi:hypothetical protein
LAEPGFPGGGALEANRYLVFASPNKYDSMALGRYPIDPVGSHTNRRADSPFASAVAKFPLVGALIVMARLAVKTGGRWMSSPGMARITLVVRCSPA